MAKAKAKVKKVSAKLKVAAKTAKKKTGKPAKAPLAKKKSTSTKKVSSPRKLAAKKTSSNKSSSKKTKTASTGTVFAPKDYSNFVTPLDDRILIRLKGTERVTAGGLFIPDTVADVSGNLQGTVVAVGRGHRSKKGHLRPLDVVLGDVVVFPQFAGSKIRWMDEDLLILREGELMGVVS